MIEEIVECLSGSASLTNLLKLGLEARPKFPHLSVDFSESQRLENQPLLTRHNWQVSVWCFSRNYFEGDRIADTVISQMSNLKLSEPHRFMYVNLEKRHAGPEKTGWRVELLFSGISEAVEALEVPLEA